MTPQSLKNRDTPENAAYWDHVERVAAEVRKMTNQEQRVEDYRSGYSAGWSDGKAGEPLRDAERAGQFFGLRSDAPCSACGNEERDHRGLLTCECPAGHP